MLSSHGRGKYAAGAGRMALAIQMLLPRMDGQAGLGLGALMNLAVVPSAVPVTPSPSSVRQGLGLALCISYCLPLPTRLLIPTVLLHTVSKAFHNPAISALIPSVPRHPMRLNFSSCHVQALGLPTCGSLFGKAAHFCSL